MGIFDDFNDAVKKARKDAQRKAAETAAKSAWNAVKKKVADLGDDFLDAAESELAEQEGKSGRLEGLPTAAGVDHRAKVLEERLKGADASARRTLRGAQDGESLEEQASRIREERADREDRAREELARLKAALKKD